MKDKSRRGELPAIFNERPRVIIDTFNVGTDKEHTQIMPYYGRYGYSINNMGDGKYQYDVFYDDIFGGVIHANNINDAATIGLNHKGSEQYFCAKDAKIKVQRRKYYQDNKYDEYGLLLNYKPRKSATLVK